MYLTSVTTKKIDKKASKEAFQTIYKYKDNSVHHETLSDAETAYNKALLMDDLYTAQLCKIISSTEPHHMVGLEGKTKDYQLIPINTINDVRAFFKYCIDEMELNFHPDTDFKDVVELGTGTPIYHEDEATVLNQKIYTCFKICADAKVDIYEMAVDEFNKIHNS